MRRIFKLRKTSVVVEDGVQGVNSRVMLQFFNLADLFSLHPRHAKNRCFGVCVQAARLHYLKLNLPSVGVLILLNFTIWPLRLGGHLIQFRE
jgi:hypothetical protein